MFPAKPWARAVAALFLCLWALLAGSRPALAESLEPVVYALQEAPGLSAPGLKVVPPEADDPRWQRITLPDSWNRSRPGFGGMVWYRIEGLRPESASLPQAIYIPRWHMNGELWLNGHRLGSSGEFVEPMPRNSHRPQLFSVPDALWRDGGNTAHIRLFAYANYRGGLMAVEAGDEPRLRQAQGRRLLLESIGPLVASTLCFSIGLFGLAVWLRRRQEVLFGYFGWASVIWSLRNLNLVVRDIPLPAPLWGWLVHSGNYVFGTLLGLFVLRFCDVKAPRFERVLWAWMIGVPLLMLVSGLDNILIIQKYTAPPVLLLLFYVAGISIVTAWRQRTIDYVLAAVVMLIYPLLQTYDATIMLEVFPYGTMYLASYAGLLVFAVFAWNLHTRYVRSLDESLRANQELNSRIEQKEIELHAAYSSLAQVKAHEAARNERAMILREMHDSLGAQLTTTLHVARRGEASSAHIADEIQEALDQMRLLLDTTSTALDVVGVLAQLRHRLGGRLETAGLSLRWEVDELPDLPPLSPAHALNLQRIVQEALSNVIKHAQARLVEIRAMLEPGGGISIRISDDGCGLARSPAAAVSDTLGHGWGNMQARAAEFGGHVRFEPGLNEQGLTVHLHLP